MIVFGHTGNTFNARIEAMLPFIEDPLKVPSTDLLSDLFPKPVEKLREVAGHGASEEVVWSLDNVQRMWRGHKGAVRHCDTMSGLITVLTDFGALVETGNSRHPVPALNTFRFPLHAGDRVYFHKCVIAEVVTLPEFLAQ